MKLRFSIRDLLWLTAQCAVLVAWWVDGVRAEDERQRLFDSRWDSKKALNTLTIEFEQYRNAHPAPSP